MSQAQMFRKLGAPLKNQRWSWGGVRESDRSVFLRVWQDGTKDFNGKRFIRISDRALDDSNPSAKERLDHIGLIKTGYRCYMVMCEAENRKANPRKVKSFNRNEVFIGGELIEDDGAYWIEIELAERRRVENCIPA